MRDIGTLDEFGVSFAQDINDKGQIVGTSKGRAFLHTERTGTIDLGVLDGDTTSAANAINNRSEIVGTSSAEDRSNAFLYTNGVMVNIETLVDPALGWEFIAANDINERGERLLLFRGFYC